MVISKSYVTFTCLLNFVATTRISIDGFRLVCTSVENELMLIDRLVSPRRTLPHEHSIQ